MKKILLIGLLLAATAVNAQPERGSWFLVPQGGVNVSMLTGDASIRVNYTLYDDTGMSGGSTVTQLSRPRLGAGLGLNMEYQSGCHWALGFGIEASRQGTRFKDTTWSHANLINPHIDLDYISVPLLARYYVNDRFAFAFGLEPRYMAHQQAKSIFSDAANVASYEVTSIAEDFTRFDATLPLSVSYHMANGTFCELRYNFGINLFKSDWIPFPPFCRNHCVSLTVGHKIKL